MLKIRKVSFFILLTIFFFVSILPSFSEESQELLYKQVLSTVKDVIDKKHDPIKGYNLLNNYISTNTDKSLADDLEVVKTAMLYEIKLYQAALDNLDMISDEYKIVSLEEITLKNVDFIPTNVVKNDFTDYSSLLNAKCYLKLKNYQHAEIYVASIYKRVKDTQFYWIKEPEFVFDVYLTYAQAFIYKNKPAMGTRILKEYMDNPFSKNKRFRDRVNNFLLDVTDKRPVGRNPFIRSDIEIVPEEERKTPTKQKSHYYVTGIVTEDEQYVIIEINKQSYIRRIGNAFGGYKIEEIKTEYIILRNLETNDRVRLYVGQGKAL